jgi:hypothetical protein
MLLMSNAASLETRNDETVARRVREYQMDLAYMVRIGDLDEATANQWAADFQDRMVREGAWK